MLNVLSMLAPKPRYSPATPCSLRILKSIRLAPEPLAKVSCRGAPGRLREEGVAESADAVGVRTSVWMRVLILWSQGLAGERRGTAGSGGDERVERVTTGGNGQPVTRMSAREGEGEERTRQSY